MLLHVWCIFLGFSRVCSKNVWHVSLLVHATELPIALKLAFLFLLALTRVSQELSQGLVYLIQYLLRVCQQTPKWLVYLCQGLASWSKHALACLGVSFQGLVGCAPKLFGMCFCQFTTELLIASKLAFLSCWRLPRLAKSSLNGWCIFLVLTRVCQQTPKWLVYLVRVQQVGPTMLLHVLVYLSGVQQGVLPKCIGMCLCQFVNRVANNFKAGFSILLALSKINQELCKGWCILSGTYQGVSTNSKMAGVSCQGLASWSNMLLHVQCIFLGFSRVAPKLLVCLCQLSTELPTTSKWLFYLVGTQQD